MIVIVASWTFDLTADYLMIVNFGLNADFLVD